MIPQEDRPRSKGGNAGLPLSKMASTPPGGGTRSSTANSNESMLMSREKTPPQKYDPRRAYREQLIEEWELKFNEAMEGPIHQLEEIKKMRERLTEEWESRFRSVQALYDSRHIEKLLKRQEKLLRLAQGVAFEKKKLKVKVDQSVDCHVEGMSLAEIQRKQDQERRRLKRLVLHEIETKVRRRFEEAERQRWKAERATSLGVTKSPALARSISSINSLSAYHQDTLGSSLQINQPISRQGSIIMLHQRSLSSTNLGNGDSRTGSNNVSNELNAKQNQYDDEFQSLQIQVPSIFLPTVTVDGLPSKQPSRAPSRAQSTVQSRAPSVMRDYNEAVSRQLSLLYKSQDNMQQQQPIMNMSAELMQQLELAPLTLNQDHQFTYSQQQSYQQEAFLRNHEALMNYYAQAMIQEEVQRLASLPPTRLTTPQKTKSGVIKGLAGVAILKPVSV
jgi:hypothetical protein